MIHNVALAEMRKVIACLLTIMLWADALHLESFAAVASHHGGTESRIPESSDLGFSFARMPAQEKPLFLMNLADWKEYVIQTTGSSLRIDDAQVATMLFGKLGNYEQGRMSLSTVAPSAVLLGAVVAPDKVLPIIAQMRDHKNLTGVPPSKHPLVMEVADWLHAITDHAGLDRSNYRAIMNGYEVPHHVLALNRFFDGNNAKQNDLFGQKVQPSVIVPDDPYHAILNAATFQLRRGWEGFKRRVVPPPASPFETVKSQPRTLAHASLEAFSLAAAFQGIVSFQCFRQLWEGIAFALAAWDEMLGFRTPLMAYNRALDFWSWSVDFSRNIISRSIDIVPDWLISSASDSLLVGILTQYVELVTSAGFLLPFVWLLERTRRSEIAWLAWPAAILVGAYGSTLVSAALVFPINHLGGVSTYVFLENALLSWVFLRSGFVASMLTRTFLSVLGALVGAIIVDHASLSELWLNFWSTGMFFSSYQNWYGMESKDAAFASGIFLAFAAGGFWKLGGYLSDRKIRWTPMIMNQNMSAFFAIVGAVAALIVGRFNSDNVVLAVSGFLAAVGLILHEYFKGQDSSPPPISGDLIEQPPTTSDSD